MCNDRQRRCPLIGLAPSNEPFPSGLLDICTGHFAAHFLLAVISTPRTPATANSAFRLGLWLPCSNARTVRSDTPAKSATSCCVSPYDLRADFSTVAYSDTSHLRTSTDRKHSSDFTNLGTRLHISWRFRKNLSEVASARDRSASRALAMHCLHPHHAAQLTEHDQS